jgi:hypothetical protein
LKGDERAFVVLVFNVCAHGEGIKCICSRSKGAGRPRWPLAETGDVVAMTKRAKQEKKMILSCGIHVVYYKKFA